MNKLLKVLPVAILYILLVCPKLVALETLTWQDCVKEARKNHPDLIAAAEQIKQTEAAKSITFSTLFPQIDSSLSASSAATKKRGATASTSSSAATGAVDTYSYGVAASQLVFDGFKTIDNVMAASEDIKASVQAYKFTSSEIRLNLRTAFVNLLGAQEMVKVAEDIFEIRRRNFELITLRYESGLENKGALLTAEANLAQAKFGINQAKRDLEVAQRQLTKEMGHAKFIPMEVKGDFLIKLEEFPDFEAIAKTNPSLRQLTFQKNAALYDIRAAYANFFPEITGDIGVGKTDSRWPPRNSQWNMGLSLSLPIFEGGLRVAQVKQAKAAFKEAEANERGMRDTIIFNLSRAWASLEDGVEALGVQEKVLTATEVRSRIAEAQYSTGFLIYDNWTIIEDNFVQAKKTNLQAKVSALLAQANWIYAKGETLEYVENN